MIVCYVVQDFTVASNRCSKFMVRLFSQEINSTKCLSLFLMYQSTSKLLVGGLPGVSGGHAGSLVDQDSNNRSATAVSWGEKVLHGARDLTISWNNALNSVCQVRGCNCFGYLGKRAVVKKYLNVLSSWSIKSFEFCNNILRSKGAVWCTGT